MKTWVYHKDQEPKIINLVDLKEFIANDWRDSPAAFLNYVDVGIDMKKLEEKDDKEILKASQVFDAVEGIRECLNGELNLEEMSKEELETYSKKHFDFDIDRRRSKKRLVVEIREMINDNS